MRTMFLIFMLSATTLACSHTSPMDYSAKARGKVTLVEPRTRLGDYLIQRKDYERMLDRGASYFIRQIQVTPIKHEEQFVGFRLDKIFPNEPYFEQGEIRVGDIVQRVNGLPIGRPEQFMQVWVGLKAKQQLIVQIIRKGEPLIVTWNII